MAADKTSDPTLIEATSGRQNQRSGVMQPHDLTKEIRALSTEVIEQALIDRDRGLELVGRGMKAIAVALEDLTTMLVRRTQPDLKQQGDIDDISRRLDSLQREVDELKKRPATQ